MYHKIRGDIRMAIGSKIRQIRLERGIKQKDLAALAGIPTITLQQYERGVTKQPKIEQIKKIAAALDVPVTVLLDIADYDNQIRQEHLEQISAALAHREKLSEEILADWEQNKDAYLSNIQSAKDNLIRVAERICTDIQETDDEAQRISDTRWLPTRLNMIAEFINANEKTLRLAFPGWRESSLPQANGNSEDK